MQLEFIISFTPCRPVCGNNVCLRPVSP